MKLDSPALSSRQVWVLMFQELPADPADPGNHAAEMAENPGVSVSSEYSAFDDLDKSSTFFEQYVIQDVRNSATAHEVLGGTECVKLFRQQLQTAGSSVVQLRLVLTDNTANDSLPDAAHSDPPLPDPPLQSLLFGSEASVFLAEHHIQGTDNTVDTGSVDSAVRDAMSSADLIWVDAWIQTESAEFRRRAAALAVQWIQQMRSLRKTEERHTTFFWSRHCVGQAGRLLCHSHPLVMKDRFTRRFGLTMGPAIAVDSSAWPAALIFCQRFLSM